MAKRLKLKLSRVIPSFQSCRSKDPSTVPSSPVPPFLGLSPVNGVHRPPPPTPPSKPSRASIKRQVSLALTSIGCGCSCSSASSSSSSSSKSISRSSHSATSRTGSPPEFHWEEEDKWHVIAKIHAHQTTTTTTTPRQKIYYYNNSPASNDDSSFTSPIAKRKRRVRKKKTTPRVIRNRISASSADSGLFGRFDENDDVEADGVLETDALVSSCRSFSTDSDFDFGSRERPSKRGVPSKTKTRRRRKEAGKSENAEALSPARLSRWLMPCMVEGKVRESFAVVKRSEDPYEDFKRSMMEMVLEKEMFEEKDLEQLLGCFLSLNSRHHHRDIVKAFSEIWEALALLPLNLRVIN